MRNSAVGFPVTVLSHEKNKGLSAARNTGINAAKGEYLLFVDSDDQLLPTAVDLLLQKAGKTSADLVMGEIQMGGSCDGIWDVAYKDDVCNGHNNIILNYLKQQWYVMVWNKVIKTDFVRKNRLYFEESLRTHEDGIWSFMTYCKTEK